MTSRARSARLVVRSVACCALVYLALLPLHGLLTRVSAATALQLLSLADPPSIISGVTTHGSDVEIFTHLTGLEAPLGTWNGENLPVFLVAALGLALAIPSSSPREKLGIVLWAALAATAVTLATATIQLQVTAVNLAHARFGLALVSPRGQALLEVANRSINLVMLLLPAAVLVLGHGPARAGAATAVPRGRLRTPLLVLLAGSVLGGLIALGRPQPGDPAAVLERVLALNPGAPAAAMARAFRRGDHALPRVHPGTDCADLRRLARSGGAVVGSRERRRLDVLLGRCPPS